MGATPSLPVPRDATATPVRVEVLGPLRLVVDGVPVDVPGHRRRAVLALLALASRHAVGVDAIIDAVWPDDPPETGRQAVHSHVSRLRRHLGPAAYRLRRVGPGYALDLGEHELDAGSARALSRSVSAQLQTDPAAAAQQARRALSMWRGAALAEFADVAPLADAAVALAELHLRLRDDALEAALATDAVSVVGEAAASAHHQPLRERSAMLHIRALAREGRTAEAMAAAAAFRRRLAEETGLDPGPAMDALEQQVAAGALRAAETAPRPRMARQVARPTGPLVGREHDRAELHRLVDAQRMVTLAGPGGVGKTRLALDVAADLSEHGAEIHVVRLAAVDEGSRVVEAVISTLDLRLAGEASVGGMAEALADREMVLVLDNCEHVAAACRELASLLLARAPRTRVLATSRVTLDVPGEYVIRLQPLPLPRDASEAVTGSRQPSVVALLEHARRRDPSFSLSDDDAPAVVEILRRLDGLPLGIELAASQISVLPVTAVRDRLGRTLDALAAERPHEDARHRSLRATIDWSYQLLAPGEQALLRALAPFPAGADLSTVEALARDTAGHGAGPPDPVVALTRLVGASLVRREPGSPSRYTLLETVRAFLLDDLDRRGERVVAEERFLGRARQMVSSIGEGLAGLDEASADQRLRAELPNLRASRDLARSHGDVDLLVDITLAVDEAAVWRDIRELWGWSLELAADPTLRDHPQRLAILGSGAEAAWLAGEPERADQLIRAGLEVVTGAAEPDQGRRLWSAAAALALFRGDFRTSREHWMKAASIADQPAPHLAGAALAAAYAGDAPGAADLLHRASLAEAERPCLSHRAFNAYVHGEMVAGSDRGLARQMYTTGVEIARECGAGFVEGVATVGLASVWRASGDPDAAAQGYLLLLDYWGRTGNATQLWTTVRNVARLLTDRGRHREAALLLAAADASVSAPTLTGKDAELAGQQQKELEQILGHEVMDALRDEATGLDPGAAARTARGALASSVEVR